MGKKIMIYALLCALMVAVVPCGVAFAADELNSYTADFDVANFGEWMSLHGYTDFNYDVNATYVVKLLDGNYMYVWEVSGVTDAFITYYN